MIFEFIKTNGDKVIKNNPVYVYINSRVSVPADSLTAVFPSGDNNDYKFVRVIYDEKVIFTGIVDSNKTVINSKGVSQAYQCRSLAGCLLDTQLIPQNIQNITDTIIYHRYLRRYGISVKELSNKPINGVLNVGRGKSVYTLLSTYCKKLFDAEPRINQWGEAVLDGKINSGSFVFTNGYNNLSKNCYSCSEINIENSRYGIIGKVYVRTGVEELGYGLPVINKKADERAVDTVRYLDASTGSGNCIYDAQRIIESSNNNALSLSVVCPCLVYNPLGGTAAVIANGDTYSDLFINGVSYTYTAAGIFTKITMNERN